ncbi:MAG: hypothetical protein K1X47_06910 [Cyclobacteriaceae bacterium]|nr:hypothetical protein [Cyclobacteriaceae bacterium]
MEQICIDKGVSEFGCACITWGLYFGYFLGFAAVVAVVVLPLLNALKAPKELAKSGLGIGILVVLFLVSYSLADSSVSMKARSLGENEASVRLIGAGLIMFYIVFVVAMVGLFYSFINKALK